MSAHERVIEQPRFKTGSLKVLAAVWNPKQTVVALAMSNGEIVLKRKGWRTCWRQEISDLVGIWYEPTKEPDTLSVETISSMCFSPDGEYLVVNLTNGRTHFFATNTGKVAYTMEAQPFVMMKWVTVEPVEEPFKQFRRKFPMHALFNFNPEGSKDTGARVRDVEHFLLTACPVTYRGTMLIGVTQSAKLFMYANGILLMKELNLLDHYKFHSMVDPTSLKVIDFLIVANKRSLNVTYQYVESDVPAFIDDFTNLPVQRTLPIIGATTLLVDYNLGWGVMSFVRSMYNTAANYSEMLYCLIFIKEMLRYTATGYDDSVFGFVERFLEITVRNYKLTGGHRDGFFCEMVKHLKGELVSTAFVDSVRRCKNAPSLKTHMAPFNDYTTKRLHYIKYGMNLVADALGHLMDIAVANLNNTDLVFERGNLANRPKRNPNQAPPPTAKSIREKFVDGKLDSTPKPRPTGPIEGFYEFITDIATFQWQIARFNQLIDKKRAGMEAFSHYVHELLRPTAEQMEMFTLDMHNYDLGALIDFIAETQRFDKKFEYPSHLVPNVFSTVPILKSDVRPETVFEEILKFVHPLGVFEVPHYMPMCMPDCPHYPEDDLTDEMRDRLLNLKTKKIFASVYQWHTDKYFDFFSPYFPEYAQGNFPPANVCQILRDKLKGPKPPIESFKRFIGPGVPHLPRIDSDDLIVRLALRPTFYLGMVPLFDFRTFADNYYWKRYPRPVCPKFHILEKTHPLLPMKILMNPALPYYDVDRKPDDILNVPRENFKEAHPDSVVVIFRNQPNGITSRCYVYYPTMKPPCPELAAVLPPALSKCVKSIQGNQFPLLVHDIAMNSKGVLIGIGPIDETTYLTQRKEFSLRSTLYNFLPVIEPEKVPIRLFWMNIFGKAVIVEKQQLELSGEPGDYYAYIFPSPTTEHAVLVSKYQSRLKWVHSVDNKATATVEYATPRRVRPPPPPKSPTPDREKTPSPDETPKRKLPPPPPPPVKLSEADLKLMEHLEDVHNCMYY
uniref:ANAPC4_WD40 domain-containing protein n=1 Tax=Panagrellus redivivus TaxID=6233 RepID=A0A7E4UZ56_PANRE